MPLPSPASAPLLPASRLLDWLNDDREIALFDVREHGQYGEGHPFLAVHVPYSQLETEAMRLAPRRSTRIVVFDNGAGADTLAATAASRLRDIGYADLHLLEGGAAAWERTGRSLFKGVNLPSKTFGEIVEHAFDVPHLSATALAERIRTGDPLVLVDGRTLAEHRKMTVPGAIPVPNGELVLRWPELVGDPSTPVVVHCAGRTRSIVGAQILRDLGVPNPVYALENGTQGWALAGFELERCSPRALPPAPATPAARRAAADALSRSTHAKALGLTGEEAQRWVDDTTRTTYVFDVRTADEFAGGSIEHARHAEGGQLLQATDLHIGVRRARVLVLDDDGLRAPVIAGWLRRLGWEAAHVIGGIRSGLRLPHPQSLPSASPGLPGLDEAALARIRESSPASRPLVIDLRPSQAFRRGHAVGSHWSIRPRLVDDVRRFAADDRARAVLLVVDAPHVAVLAAADLREAGWTELAFAFYRDVQAAGWPQEATPSQPSDEESIDYLFFVHDRHDGNLDAARRYLEWETGLIAQCAPEELAVFRVTASSDT